jgi:hypothetical protein
VAVGLDLAPGTPSAPAASAVERSPLTSKSQHIEEVLQRSAPALHPGYALARPVRAELALDRGDLGGLPFAFHEQHAAGLDRRGSLRSGAPANGLGTGAAAGSVTSLTAKAGNVSIDFTNMAALAHNVTVASSSGTVVGATPTFHL